MIPARIYRTSLGPDTSQTLKAGNAQPGSESRIFPVGELITSRGNRIYTLWANEQQRGTDRNATQVAITNIDSTTGFMSYRGVSHRSPLDVVDDFSNLVRTRGLTLVSLSVVQESFVAVISTDKNWDQLREQVLFATR